MSCQLIHGMGENFAGPCDLVFTHLYGQLNTALKGKPMLLSGFAQRKSAYQMWSFAELSLVGTWGKKQDQAVWSANMPAFTVNIADLVEDEFAENRGWFPLELPRRLLAACVEPDKFSSLIVADPFMGRGTIGKAVLERGGSFIGVDRDKQRVKLASVYLGCASL